MDRSATIPNPLSLLYPQLEPYDSRFLDVGDGHRLYVEQCGHPEGLPVLVLHGGPGGGCSPTMRRFFDPSAYRAVLFDQRGCGRSRPLASVEANTTPHLIADIERIREALGIRRWIIFGGSWGATLALAYAETHPERVAFLMLRGVFLGTQDELDWFYGGGAGRFFPELWEGFAGPIPEAERGDLIAAYHKRLFSGDIFEETRFGKLWSEWENALATIETRAGQEAPGGYARAFARLENHYFTNGCFLGEDGALLANAHRLSGIPGQIVQGRYDMICPPLAAQRLHALWPESRMHYVPLAGHAMSEPGITAALVEGMNRLRSHGRLLDLI